MKVPNILMMTIFLASVFAQDQDQNQANKTDDGNDVNTDSNVSNNGMQNYGNGNEGQHRRMAVASNDSSLKHEVEKFGVKVELMEKQIQDLKQEHETLKKKVLSENSTEQNNNQTDTGTQSDQIQQNKGVNTIPSNYNYMLYPRMNHFGNLANNPQFYADEGYPTGLQDDEDAGVEQPNNYVPMQGRRQSYLPGTTPSGNIVTAHPVPASKQPRPITGQQLLQSGHLHPVTHQSYSPNPRFQFHRKMPVTQQVQQPAAVYNNQQFAQMQNMLNQQRRYQYPQPFYGRR